MTAQDAYRRLDVRYEPDLARQVRALLLLLQSGPLRECGEHDMETSVHDRGAIDDHT